MSLDIKKSCSFQILISLTTVVRPGYCHLKSEVAALCTTVIWNWLQYHFWPQSYIQVL